MARTLVIGLAVAGLAGLVATIGLAAPPERPDLGRSVVIESEQRRVDAPSPRANRPAQRDDDEPTRRDDRSGELEQVDDTDDTDDRDDRDDADDRGTDDAVLVPVEVETAPRDAGAVAGGGGDGDDDDSDDDDSDDDSDDGGDD
jgi:hypothetical protein